MSTELRPDGTPVTIAGVDVSAFGLAGNVEVHLPASPGMRAAEDARPPLSDVLKRHGMLEQLTVEIDRPEAHPESLARPGTGRGSGAAEPMVTLNVPGPGSGLGQVLLACDEQGILTWHIPEDIAPAEAATRGGDRRTYRIPARVLGAAPGGKRGLIGAIGKKLFKVVVFKLVQVVAGVVGHHYVARYEQSRLPHRLRPFTPDDYRQGDIPDLALADEIDRLTAGPALLFIHGTGSRTHKAFANLPPDFVSRLNTKYEGRVIAFDHPTLSVTPTDNVAWLGDLLGSVAARRGLELDIVAHSRGGLVGRVLCECPSTAGLDSTRLHVRNLVMVATPNAGTPLADCRHLDKFINTFTNLFQFIPDNPATDTLDVVVELVKQAALGVMEKLEGLMAMDPNGEYLQRLNVSSHLEVAYHALAADYEPPPNSPLGRYARDALTDLVFAKQNDLVVPTEGVFAANGGGGFPITDVVTFDKSAGIDHSGFWNVPKARDVLDHWLDPHAVPTHA